MATIFLEPGGDAEFGVGLWPNKVGSPAVATDFVHGGHIKSIKYRANNLDYLLGTGFVTDAGGRVSIYFYFNALPTATADIMLLEQTGDGAPLCGVAITTAGVLRLVNSSNTVIGSAGSTLSTGTWYRLTFAWKITSGAVNELRLFKNGTLDISVTNTSLTTTSSADFWIGNGSDTTLDMRTSDHYIDNSNALTDPATDIWVTAKRPNANGTTNGFTTQIGSGGSGYGTGSSPQVNERPNSDSNGWSIIGAGSAVTEEYNIESAATGDIDISAATLIDYMGWVRSKSLASETASIIVNGASSNISLTSTIAFFRKIAGSSTYPAGTGTDIGEISSTTVTTVSLYEAGIVIAYTPAVVSATASLGYKTLLGVGL